MKSPHKILIVDDEPYSNRVLKLKFENAGYEVITACNGLEGLNKYKTEFPDVVISDIRMPLMNGQEMCQYLKEAGNGKPLLTIVITSTIAQNEREWVNKIENAILIEKPISPGHLLSIVENYFKNIS